MWPNTGNYVIDINYGYKEKETVRTRERVRKRERERCKVIGARERGRNRASWACQNIFIGRTVFPTKGAAGIRRFLIAMVSLEGIGSARRDTDFSEISFTAKNSYRA